MATSFVGYASNVSILTGGSLDADLTALSAGTLSAGDGVLAIVSGGTNADRNVRADPTLGYTEITDLYNNDSNDSDFHVYFKEMGATPDTTFTVLFDVASTNGVAVQCRVYRGFDSASPFNVTATTAGDVNGEVIDPAAITPTTGCTLLTVCGGAAVDEGGTSYSAGYLSDLVSITSGGSQAKGVCTVGDVAYSSGTYDPAAFTWSGTPSTANAWSAATIAWNDAATGTTVSLDALSYTETLPDLSVSVAVTIGLDAVSYAETVPALTLSVNTPVALAAVSYSETVPALSVGLGVALDAVAYTVTLPAIDVALNAVVSLDAVSYAETVPALTVQTGTIPVDLDAVSYSETVPDVAVAVNAPVALDAISYAQSVPDITVSTGNVISLSAIGYSETVPAIGVAVDTPIALGAVTYAVSVPALTAQVDTPVALGALSFTVALPALGITINTPVNLGVVTNTVSILALSIVQTGLSARRWASPDDSANSGDVLRKTKSAGTFQLTGPNGGTVGRG